MAGFACILIGQSAAQAQILGEQTPGTPGAIDGELRVSRGKTLSIPSDPKLAPQTDSGQKFGIKKNPNPAVRTPRPEERVPAGYPGASPMGQTNAMQRSSTIQSASKSSSQKWREPQMASETLPPLGQPSIAGRAAPGLPPIVTPVPKRPPLENDPYAPVGIRAGSFILRPALDVGGGYDSNVARSGTSPKSSALYRTEAEIKAASDWSQHQLNLDLRGAYSGYTSVENANKPEAEMRAALRLDATRDLAIDAEWKSRLDTESSSSVNASGGTTGRTPYYTQNISLGATQKFGHASLGLKGLVDRIDYADAKGATGSIDQSSRNYTGFGLRLRAGYEVSPGIAPFIEVGADQRRYDTETDGSGYRRSSAGSTAKIGTTFELDRTLTGEAALGYTMRAYEDARLAHLKSPTLDTQLTWSISPLTTLNLRAQTEIAETTIVGSSGAYSYRGTATLTHAFLRNFTATATLGYAMTEYDKVAREERILTAGLRLDYKFTRMIGLRASYAYENMQVNVAGSSYDAHTILLGMRFTP